MNHNEALTTDQHRTHRPRIQAAADTLDALIRDLIPVQTHAQQALAAAVRANRALSQLRAELENLALATGAESLYDNATQEQ